MTKEQKNQIAEMRKDGRGYKAIAASLGIPLYSVKTFCRRNGLMSADIAAIGSDGTLTSHNSDASEIRSGNTVFVITTIHSEKAAETLDKKLEKLILDAAVKECGACHFVHE